MEFLVDLWYKQASEMAIMDSGYIAPEHVESGNNSTKADTYAFGVLLIELLTGRKPFDRFITCSIMIIYVRPLVEMNWYLS